MLPDERQNGVLLGPAEWLVMVDIATLKSLNTARWRKANLTRVGEFLPVAKRLITAKARYQAVEKKTGVPWFVIAVIHERESSQSWLRSLGQGDPWNEVSTHVPAGRGPFPSWEAAAIDALVKCRPYTAQWKDWSPGGTMTQLEMYNGLAYANAGRPSPYVWSGTDQYRIGKVTRDHGPIEEVVDKQLGCAGLILAMMELDTSVSFIRVVVAPLPPPDIEPIPPQAIPAPTNWLVVLITAFINAFKRK